MGIGDAVQTWLLKVALRKAVVRIVQVAVSLVAAHQADMLAWGIALQVDPVMFEAAAASAVAGALEVGRNWLKVKYPQYFSWL